MKRLLFCLVVLHLPLLFCGAKVTRYGVNVLQSYPHDEGAYTQGLFFHDGTLYETTGVNGESSVRKVDLKTGRVIAQSPLSKRYFGEGSCIVADRMYVLTWTNKVAFVYDPSTLKCVRTISYPREGWGLASIPKTGGSTAVMVASDGSSNLYFLDADLRTVKTLSVTVAGRPMRLLNELEWIDGRIWANVYMTDMIAVINPSSGQVEAIVDCSNLYPAAKRSKKADVLNGIALDADGSIYLTGKYWPAMYKIQLKRL